MHFPVLLWRSLDNWDNAGCGSFPSRSTSGNARKSLWWNSGKDACNKTLHVKYVSVSAQKENESEEKLNSKAGYVL